MTFLSDLTLLLANVTNMLVFDFLTPHLFSNSFSFNTFEIILPDKLFDGTTFKMVFKFISRKIVHPFNMRKKKIGVAQDTLQNNHSIDNNFLRLIKHVAKTIYRKHKVHFTVWTKKV